ncbi:Ankyrin repeat protein [Rickettsiales bacterium Ac37b]|nr:Ankyrin repeat protein [Rickettsiales bacterium Ac37b]
MQAQKTTLKSETVMNDLSLEDKIEELKLAPESGDLKTVESLWYEIGDNISSKDKVIILKFAVESKHSDIVEFFLGQITTEDFSVEDRRELSKLTAQTGNKKIVESWLTKMERELSSSDVEVALRAAASNGYDPIVNLIFTKFQIPASDWGKAFNFAAISGKQSVIDLLLEKLKELPLSEKDEKTVSTYKGAALDGAVRNGQELITKYLMEKIGDDISIAAKGKSLISSVKSKYPDITKMLLEEYKDEMPLKYIDEAKAFAIKYGYEDIEEILNDYFAPTEVNHSISDNVVDASSSEDTEYTIVSSKPEVVGEDHRLLDEL